MSIKSPERLSDCQASLTRTIWWLGGSLAVLIVILLIPSIAAVAFGAVMIPSDAVRRHFEPDYEGNFFTWYSSFLLLLLAGAALLNGWLERRPALGPITSGRYLWWLIGVIPLFLSIDEVSQIHESVGLAVSMEGARHPGSQLWSWFAEHRHAWIVVYLPAIVGAALFILLNLRRLLGNDRHAFPLACLALAFWCGSFPLEYFREDLTGVCGARCRFGEKIANEGLELLGSLGLLLAFLLHARVRLSRLMVLTIIPRGDLSTRPDE